MNAKNSFLYEGTVFHSRSIPHPHAFQYGLYLLYLDLDELPQLQLAPLFGLESFRPLTFKRKDYLGGTGDLRDVVRGKVESTLGFKPKGPVRMLTQVRSFGYVFNPVSFYYCFQQDGETLEAVVAEITNTPWNEKHTYALPTQKISVKAEFSKEFHISPFQPMDQSYRWSFSFPGETLRVDMENEQEGKGVFRAGLRVERKPLSRSSLLSAALRYPLMGWKVPLAIYGQALQLWLKREPYYPHPKELERRKHHAIHP